jgi:hypothetical protein
VTVHRAAWALRAAVVAAVGAATLTVAAAPAYADHDLRLGPIGNIEVQAGGSSQNVQILVENRAQGDHDSEDGVARGVQVTMTVPGGIGAVIQSAPNGCGLGSNNTRMDCTVDIPPGGTFSGVAQIGANGNAPVEAGESRSDVGEIFLSTGARQQFNVKVNGPEKAPSVKEVSGVVTDRDTGEPVPGARVILKDGQGVEHQATTDENGNFRFSADQNIAPGSIGLRASKDGFEFGSPPTLTVGPDETRNDIQLALASTATPSPAPSATATPSATPSATATAAATPVAAAEPASGGGFFTTMLIVLGGLFVALGVGAIVLLVIRQRRRAQEEEDGPDGVGGPPPGPRGPRPAPGSHGVYRPTPTQVAGAGGGAQTQVIRPGPGMPAVGPRPALANSPTMMQRGAAGSAADETALLPRAGGPPGPAGPGSPTGTAAGPRSGPGSPTPRSGAPAEPGAPGPGYGSPAAAPGSGSGYRGDRPPYSAYDQPTGRHERPGYPPDRPGYPAERPRHESEASSYGPDPYTQPSGTETRHDGRGYEPRAAEPRGGYGGGHDTGGYDAAAYDGQGYSGQGYSGQGYEGRGYEGRGHDRPGHDQGYQGQGYEGRGYEGQGHDRPGYDQGYQGQGYQGQGYQGQGYQGQGYEGRGYEGQGYPEQGYQNQGYQNQGYGGRGYDERGGYGGDPGYEPPPEQRRGDDYQDDPETRPRHSGASERRLDWLD